MKKKIVYLTEVTETITIPKEFEFYFKKDEFDWTEKEVDLFEDKFGEAISNLLSYKIADGSDFNFED